MSLSLFLFGSLQKQNVYTVASWGAAVLRPYVTLLYTRLVGGFLSLLFFVAG